MVQEKSRTWQEELGPDVGLGVEGGRGTCDKPQSPPHPPSFSLLQLSFSSQKFDTSQNSATRQRPCVGSRSSVKDVARPNHSSMAEDTDWGHCFSSFPAVQSLALAPSHYVVLDSRKISTYTPNKTMLSNACQTKQGLQRHAPGVPASN